MRIAIVLTLLLLAANGHASPPSRVPLQGFLTDSNGMPVSGPKQIEFRLYDAVSGGAAWFTETQIVDVDTGAFTAYLGAVVPLDLKELRRGTAHLGITLQGEGEMTPRLEMATVPFAAYAQETAAVPPGAVMFFDLDACPPGWSALDAARGRALVGVPTGGTRGGAVGTPYGDQEARTHDHTVDPASVTCSSAGAHSHSVDLAAATTSSTSLSHSHTVDPPSTSTTTDSHNHAWSRWDFATKDWFSYAANGSDKTVVAWDDGTDSAGAGQYPLQTAALASETMFTSQDSHAHTVDIPTLFSNTVSSTHSHSVNLPATPSSTDGTHTHACDVLSTTSSAASSTPPYLQLLVCRKD